MSDLQIGLVVLGILLVAGIWMYNRWQEQRHRQMTEHLFPSRQASADVLMPAREEKAEPAIAPLRERIGSDTPREPGFMDPDLPLEPDSVALAEAADMDILLEGGEGGATAAPVPIPDEWGDGRVDCTLSLVLAAPCSARQLLESGRHELPDIDKPIQWLGLDADSRHWRTLTWQDDGKVTQLALALQMVDRLGAVSEETLAAFVAGVSRLARQFDGRIASTDLAPLLARARELDAFCASVDLQLTLHVLPRLSAHMSGVQLKKLLDNAGLQLEGERFVSIKPDGTEAYSLICRSVNAFTADRVASMELIDLIFSLDVPRVANGARTFDQMVEFSRHCSDELGGQLADAHRKPLPDQTVALIRGRIDELQNRMTERGIPPGSVRALRLFS